MNLNFSALLMLLKLQPMVTMFFVAEAATLGQCGQCWTYAAGLVEKNWRLGLD